jgi:D-beta-D-heptose 7-phosphate kinase/D-beta-D-heptose 1-phosphate adenosyltransferase
MNILVIGDALIDKYTYATPTRPSPEADGAWVYDVDKEWECPGGGLNVAANLASLLNQEIFYSGIVDADRRSWLQYNYRLRDVYELCSTTFAPLIKQRLIDQKTGKQLLRLDNRQRFTNGSIADLDTLYARDGDVLTAYDCIVVSDYCKGTVTDRVLRAIKEHATCPVFVDTKREDLSVFADIDNCIVKINLQEYGRCENEETVDLIVTQGGNGAHYYPKQLMQCAFSVQGKPIKDADTTGAGDAYLAGLVIGYLQSGLDIEMAMRKADLVARASVRKQGTTIVRITDIEEEMWNDYQRCIG